VQRYAYRQGIPDSGEGRRNAKPFLKLTLQQVFVTSQQVSASTEIPTESVSFSYDSINSSTACRMQGVVTTTGSSTYSVSKNTVT